MMESCSHCSLPCIWKGKVICEFLFCLKQQVEVPLQTDHVSFCTEGKSERWFSIKCFGFLIYMCVCVCAWTHLKWDYCGAIVDLHTVMWSVIIFLPFVLSKTLYNMTQLFWSILKSHVIMCCNSDLYITQHSVKWHTLQYQDPGWCRYWDFGQHIRKARRIHREEVVEDLKHLRSSSPKLKLLIS